MFMLYMEYCTVQWCCFVAASCFGLADSALNTQMYAILGHKYDHRGNISSCVIIMSKLTMLDCINSFYCVRGLFLWFGFFL